MFIVDIDGFRINYYNIEDSDHLLNALHRNYTVSKDWISNYYCGLTVDWYYIPKVV